MNLASMAALQAAAIQLGSEPALRPDAAAPSQDTQAQKQARERQFEETLRRELQQRQPAPNVTPSLWLQMDMQSQAVDDGEENQAINGASAANATGNAATGWSPASLLSPFPRKAIAPAEPEAVTSAEKPEPPQEVRIVVEAGLPPVQPARPQADEPVPLVNFPQVVVGQVQQMVQNQQPLTQLDFQISPPTVGPVTMQVSLQNGAVNVQLAALTIQAKQALENQVGMIQSILASHGLAPGEIKVVAGASGKSGAQGAGHKGEQPAFSFGTGGRRRGNSKDMTVRA